MNRRKSIRDLAASAVGLMALPKWAHAWTDIEISRSSVFTATESQLLASVVDTILPTSKTGLGGLSLEVDLFLQKLFDECYPAETQQLIKSGLNFLDALARVQYQIPFNDCRQVQRQEVLLNLEKSKDKRDRDFFRLMKEETIRGFRTSREVMMRHYEYRVAPGYFQGCIDIDS